MKSLRRREPRKQVDGTVAYNRTPSAANSYLPSPLLMAGLIGMQTQRLEVGTCVLFLPLYHPVHLAEDCAIVDLANKGRLVVSVGVGYQPPELHLHSFAIAGAAQTADCLHPAEVSSTRFVSEGPHFCKADWRSEMDSNSRAAL